jgi:chromosomal replication initiation ATPase DnaA
MASAPPELETLTVDQALSLVERLSAKFGSEELDAVLRSSVGEDVYTSWFARMDREAVQDESVRMSAPTRFLKSWIQAHYAERVLSRWQAEMPEVHRVDLTVRTAVRSKAEKTQRPPDPQASEDEGSEADWQDVVAEVLRLLGAELLDTPSSHLAYIRERIKPVIENGPVEP